MQQAARTYYHTCPDCKSNLDPGERCACQSPEHRRQEFSAWMDKRMDEYRAAGIPFIGYLWVNYNSRQWGGALFNLNKCSAKVKTRKEVLRVIKQLEREFGTQVYTYMG